MIGRNTPWGSAQETKTLAPGIVRVWTAGHGGYLVTPAALAKWPTELQAYQPYAGPGAFEEDCDWAIVALAVPELFSAEARYHAWQTLNREYGPSTKSMAGEDRNLSRYLDETSRGRAFVSACQEWHAEQVTRGTYYTAGGCTNGNGWNDRWQAYSDTLPALIVTHKNVPSEYPQTPPTRQDLERLYGAENVHAKAA